MSSDTGKIKKNENEKMNLRITAVCQTDGMANLVNKNKSTVTKNLRPFLKA